MVGYKETKQAGFAAVAILIALVIAATLGGVAYLVLKPDGKKKVNSTTTAEAVDTTTKDPTTIPTTPQEQVTTKATLVIKEWGISIPLPDSLKDAYYTTKGSGTGADGVDNTAWISLTSLRGTSCDVSTTGPTETANALGAVLRVLPTDVHPVKGGTYKELYPNGVTIRGYYYVYVPAAKTTCLSTGQLQSLSTAFADAVKYATPAI